MAPVVPISVVVVAHDSGELLLRCVQAVLTQGDAVELIVVDNASHDGSIERLPLDPRLQLLRNHDNPGFGVACNQGAGLAHGEYVLFLNPDCLLPPQTIEHLLERARAHPEIGLLGAQLLDPDGREQSASRRHAPRPARAWRRALGLRDGSVEHAPGEVRDGVETVDAVSGALMLMRREIFLGLGGFDPGYVLHCEDLDLCRRVQHMGLEVALVPAVRVPHHKGSSSRRRPIWVEWQKHRGMLRYFRKFDAASAPRWLRLAVPLGVWLRFPFAALRAWRAAQR